MEATKRLASEEDRRLKLLQYLASKGKLKPQNNAKPYLKDCTNLQNIRPQISKQICEKDKEVSSKGTRLGHGPIKNSSSNIELVQYRSKTGKTPAQKTGLEKKTDILLKIQKTQVLTDKRLTKSEDIMCIQTKCTSKREQRTSQSRLPVTRSLSCRTQAPSTKPIHQSSTQQAAGKSIHVTSDGYSHKASGINQLTSKSRSTAERSTLMKSSRTDGSHPKQPQSMPGAQVKESCASKPKTTKPAAPLTSTALKSLTTDPLSVPKMKQDSRSYTFKKPTPGQKQQPVNKPATSLKTTGLPSCNKTPIIRKVMHDEQTNGRERRETNTTNEVTKPCNVASMGTNRPQTPRMTAEDRKKQLQEWLSSKGKTYKRPPMTQLPKRPSMSVKQQTLNPLNHSLWDGLQEEEEMFGLSRKISQTLTECLELIKKGISSEDIQAALDKVPDAKRFAKYWVCKAMLLEREGVFDVVDLYKQGVQCGAMPIDELRDVVFDIMKNVNKKNKVVTFGPLPNDDVLAEKKPCENKHMQCCNSPPYSPVMPIGNVRTPCTGISTCDQGSAVKFQIVSLSSKKDVSDQGWKRLTPVRRSLRIHHSVSQYPDVVQEHDHVVSSLDQLLETADADTYMYMRNEALPQGVDCIHGMITQDTLKDQSEESV